MARTGRIEELLRILPERPWTDEEELEVRMIIGDDDRRSQFEIEGDWPSESKYDKPRRQMPVEDVRAARENLVMPKDASPLPTSQPEDIAIRLAQLEATTTELFAKLKALEARVIRDDA